MMNKPIVFAITTLFAALTATAQTQAPAAPVAAPAPAAAPAKAPAAAPATDPIVQMHAEEAAARKTYKEKVAAAKKDREAEMKPSIDAAVKDATAQGKDPLVARRDAEKKASAATRKSYDAKVEAAKKERDTALAAARKKGAGKA